MELGVQMHLNMAVESLNNKENKPDSSAWANLGSLDTEGWAICKAQRNASVPENFQHSFPLTLLAAYLDYFCREAVCLFTAEHKAKSWGRKEQPMDVDPEA